MLGLQLMVLELKAWLVQAQFIPCLPRHQCSQVQVFWHYFQLPHLHQVHVAILSFKLQHTYMYSITLWKLSSAFYRNVFINICTFMYISSHSCILVFACVQCMIHWFLYKFHVVAIFFVNYNNTQAFWQGARVRNRTILSKPHNNVHSEKIRKIPYNTEMFIWNFDWNGYFYWVSRFLEYF